MANIWETSVITNKGLALQSKTMAGGTILMTSVKAGTGIVEIGQLMSQTDVTDIKQIASIQYVEAKDNKAILNVALSNNGVEEAYDLRQIGFYANDPDEGEILYAIAQSSKEKHVPSETEMPGYTIEWDFYFVMNNGVSMSVEVDPAGIVTMGTFKALEEKVFLSDGSKEMTGNLKIKKNSPSVQLEDIGDGTGILQYIIDKILLRNTTDEGTVELEIHPSSEDLEGLLQLVVNNENWYNIYGEHNKPTINDVSGVKTETLTLTLNDGSTVTKNFVIKD